MADGVSTVDNMFRPYERKEIGNKRSVWDVSPIPVASFEGDAHFIVKDRTSERELEILRFLHGRGISEELLAYDRKKLVCREIRGERWAASMQRFMHMATTQAVPAQQGNSSRFRIDSIVALQPSDNIIEYDVDARRLSALLVARFMFLTSNGIFHNDIKTDNLLVSDGAPVFIDFGEATVAGLDGQRLDYPGNLEKIIDLMADLHSNFHELLATISKTRIASDRDFRLGYPILRELFMQFNDVPLDQRQRIVADYFRSGEKFDELLSSINVPEMLRGDVSLEFNRLINV